MIVIEIHIYDDDTDRHYRTGWREEKKSTLDDFYRALKYLFRRCIEEILMWKEQEHKAFEKDA